MTAATPGPDSAAAVEIRRRIRAGFRGTVPPIQPSFGYQVALVGAAAVMLLTPVVYAALVGAVVWGIWRYFSRFSLSELSPGIRLAVLPAWILPPALGLVVLICLAKPLFFRIRAGGGGLRLDPAKEPLVFDLVRLVCKALGTQVPKEIRVDCEANASASFRRGLASLFSDDLMIQIGLPLVEGLTLQQLAGVIAHEMGHFSQKAGLRMSMIVRILNAWLVRLVYQRDRFDAMIDNTARRSQAASARRVIISTQFLIWLSRRILWIAMLAGNVVSSFVMKHLEYDADRYQVRLTGFDSFDVVMREIFAMGVAYRMAIDDLQEQWKDKCLVDNLPRLVLAHRQDKVRQIAADLEAYLANEKEELFVTHPPARRRIAQALREKGVGVFSSDLPASALFADLSGIERAASLRFYMSVLGNKVRPADLLPVEALRDHQQQSEAERSALARFFQNINPLRAISLPARVSPSAAVEDRAEGIRRLEEARRAVAESSASHARAIADHREAVKARFSALRADALLRAGYSIHAQDFMLSNGDLWTAMGAAAQAKERMGNLGSVLAEHEETEVRRLEAALALFTLPEIAEKLSGVSVAEGEIERLFACGAFLADRFPRLLALREACAVLDVLVTQLTPVEEPPVDLVPEINRLLISFREDIKDLHRALRAQMYPFDHGRQETTLAQYCIPSMPADDDLQGLIKAADVALGRTAEIEARLLGRLAWIAEKVEDSLGMPPLERSADDDPPPAAKTDEIEEADDAAPVEVPLRIVEMRRIPESTAEAVQCREVFARYLRNPLELRAIPLPDQAPEPPADPQAAIEDLWAALLSLKKELEENGRRVLQYRGAEQRWIKAIQAEELLHAGLVLRPEDFGLVTGDLANAGRLRDRSAAQMESLEPALATVEAMQGRRLTQALVLLGEPQVAARLDGEVRSEEVAPLFAAAVGLHRSFPALRALRRSQLLLGILIAQGPAAQARRQLGERLGERMAEVNRQLRRLQRNLHVEPYPFDHPGESCHTLAQRMIPRFPLAEDYGGTYTAVNLALREAADLQRRALGRLAAMAERVEHALGLGL
jgi:hypothetical protein